MKLSPKHKPKIERLGHPQGCNGYNWDNGKICFDKPSQRKKKEEQQLNP